MGAVVAQARLAGIRGRSPPLRRRSRVTYRSGAVLYFRNWYIPRAGLVNRRSLIKVWFTIPLKFMLLER